MQSTVTTLACRAHSWPVSILGAPAELHLRNRRMDPKQKDAAPLNRLAASAVLGASVRTQITYWPVCRKASARTSSCAFRLRYAAARPARCLELNPQAGCTERLYFAAIVTGGLEVPETVRITGTASPACTPAGMTAFT